MKRVQWVLVAVMCACLSPVVFGQMGGMNFFKKPNIADIFNPTVGMGAEYQSTDKDDKTPKAIELTIVGKEMVDGKEGYWMEFSHAEHNGQTMYGKVLVTKDDFQMHKMIVMTPDAPQPIEMPFSADNHAKQNMDEEMQKWHSVGSETITVPAGTFLCEHWTKDSGKGDVWISSKVSPMRLVKSVDENQTMVLSKIITDAKDHITGTPMKFDPHMMRQMHKPQQ